MRTLIKNIIFIILLEIIISSCWAPRCPVRSCQVKVEHRHEELKGIYGGKVLIPNRIHYLWDKDKGEKNPNTKWEKESKDRRKLRKKFPWERW